MCFCKLTKLQNKLKYQKNTKNKRSKFKSAVQCSTAGLIPNHLISSSSCFDDSARFVE